VKAVLPGARTFLIHNGVDAARYQANVPLPEKRGPTILAVGQVKARKGFHVLAQAMRSIRAAIPEVNAVFIGSMADQGYIESINAQLKADGLTDAVHWLGRVPDETLLGWYQAADIFALPAVNIDGKFEGFGLVYLEASAAGLPVIGTLDNGAEDAIRQGVTGFLIPQNDPDALAQTVIRLLRDSNLREKMGSAGKAYSEQHTWDKIAQRVVEVYRTKCE
jgi:phosphatidyl-myo-inositol dimannoside synthase